MMHDASQNDHIFGLSLTAFAACVLSFLSVYVSGSNQDSSTNGWINNVLDPNLREACMAALFTVLYPSISTVVGYLPLLPKVKGVGETDTQRQDIVNGKMNSTLTLVEKFLFVLGILCMCVLYPTLQHSNMDILVKISVSFLNGSTTLMVTAIMSFLCRRSSLFTPWKTWIIVILVCVSDVINSCALMITTTTSSSSSSSSFNNLFFASNVLFDLAALMYATICLYSLLRWLRLNVYKGRMNKVEDLNTKDQSTLSEEEAIKQLVVAIHMFSTFIVMTVNAVSMWYIPTFTAYQLSIIMYIRLSTALLVFVFDDYAKIHIVIATLWSLLDAKTDYVRYISHEVRTPLSATLMGLRLMLDDYKKSNPRPGSVDADRLDTLQDINSSCVSALDILNDLLCFNKLEAGLLELNREIVCPGTFVKDSVALFNVQARDCGVNLSVVLNKPSIGDDDDGNDEGSLVSLTRSLINVGNRVGILNNILQRKGSSNSSGGGGVVGVGLTSNRRNTSRRDTLTRLCSCLLRENDIISLDKFKIDQVIRNLVSNAIKFSPRGGEVTVYAYFDSDPLPMTATTTAAAPNNHQIHSTPDQQNESNRNESNRSRRKLSIFSQWAGGSANNIVVASDALRQSLVRVVSNNRLLATPASPHLEGTKPSSAASTTTTTFGKLVVVVTDNGPGISAENQKRLFKEVIQFSPEKLQAGGGSGFGLFITKSIVDLHEGTISVYSEGEGKGTSFTLELPMSRTTVITESNDSQMNRLVMESRESKSVISRTHQPFQYDAVVAGIPESSPSPVQETSPPVSHVGSVPTILDAHDPPNDISTANAILRPMAALGNTIVAGVIRRDGESALSTVRDGRGRELMLSQGHNHHPSIYPPNIDAAFPPGNGSKGNLMLRQLSRQDSINPQSVTVSYRVAKEQASNRKSAGSPVHPNLSPVISEVLPKNSADVQNTNVGVHSSGETGLHTLPYMGVGDSVRVEDSECNVQRTGQNRNTINAPISPKWDILIVDDSPLNRKMLMKTLRSAGHICDEAENGQEGINMVQRRKDTDRAPYDVILMDFVMPVMNGPTATKHLRTDKEFEYTGPIIGLTGNAMPADINHFIAHGASAVLIKPIDLSIFNATMKQINDAK